MAALNRTAQIVGYLLSHSGAVGHTRLLKLLYLADLESRRLRGRPISDLRYRFHHFGPFDAGIYTALGELERSRLVEERLLQHPGGKVERQLAIIGEIPDDAINPVDEHLLGYVCRTYARLPLDDLLKIVYETGPMKDAVRGRSISMEAENNKDREEVGFDLDRLIANYEAAERGDYMTGTDFFDALRAKIASRG